MFKENAMKPEHWQQVAERSARYGWLILLAAIVVALIGGVISAATWQSGVEDIHVVIEECENPPCFGWDGWPSIQDLPFVLAMMGYLLAIVLGFPSLLVGIWSLLSGRWAAAGRWLLMFIGPVVFFVGTEIIPHLLNPCWWTLEWSGQRLPEFYCAYNPAWGADLADRWHLLDHTLIGALPLAALYWLALRRWHPDVVRSPES
jgi:hypothetical protein